MRKPRPRKKSTAGLAPLQILRPKKGKSVMGFTLIELIFEIFVLLIVVIPTILLLGQLFLNVSATETNTIATDLCMYKSEELLANYDYGNIGASAGNFNYVSPAYASYSYTVVLQYVDANNPSQVVSWTPPNPEPEYKRVTVTVSRAGIPNVAWYLLFVKDI